MGAAVGPVGDAFLHLYLGMGLCAFVLEALWVRLVVEALATIGAALGGRRGFLLRFLLRRLHNGRVGAHVAVQVRAPGEGPTALPALEGLLTRMNALVPLKVGAPGEGLPTHPALIGLPTQVALLVPGQGTGVREAAAALRAAVRLLPTRRMGTLVGEQGRADAEAAPAVGAGVGALPSVHTLVDGQV